MPQSHGCVPYRPLFWLFWCHHYTWLFWCHHYTYKRRSEECHIFFDLRLSRAPHGPILMIFEKKLCWQVNNLMNLKQASLQRYTGYTGYTDKHIVRKSAWKSHFAMLQVKRAIFIFIFFSINNFWALIWTLKNILDCALIRIGR